MAICINRTLFILNDLSFVVGPITNTIDGSFMNIALVNATLKDKDGNNVAGQSWPLRLNYLVDSDGMYQGILQDTLQLIENDTYLIIIDVDSEGLQAHTETELIALKRG